MAVTLAELTDDSVLNNAYEWLCHRRRNYPDNADAWMVFGPFSLEGADRAELNAKMFLNTNANDNTTGTSMTNTNSWLG